MIVDLKTIPVNKLKDLLNEKNKHIEPVFSSAYYLSYHSNSTSDTVYKKVIKKAKKFNASNEKFIKEFGYDKGHKWEAMMTRKHGIKAFCTGCMDLAEKNIKYLQTGQYSLIDSEFGNKLIKMFICKRYL